MIDSFPLSTSVSAQLIYICAASRTRYQKAINVYFNIVDDGHTFQLQRSLHSGRSCLAVGCICPLEVDEAVVIDARLKLGLNYKNGKD